VQRVHAALQIASNRPTQLVARETLSTVLRNNIINTIGELFYCMNFCFCYVEIWRLNNKKGKVHIT
jgi:hypothetical protein